MKNLHRVESDCMVLVLFVQLCLIKILRYIIFLSGRETTTAEPITVVPSLERIKMKLLVYKQEESKWNKTEVEIARNSMTADTEESLLCCTWERLFSRFFCRQFTNERELNKNNTKEAIKLASAAKQCFSRQCLPL